MFQEMMPMTQGGGSVKFKAGTFTSSATGEVTVSDVGFKPKYLAIMFQGGSGTPTTTVQGAMRIIYDERISTTYCHRGMWGSEKSVTSLEIKSSATVNTLREINDNGFVFYNSGSASQFYGTYYYFAIG